MLPERVRLQYEASVLHPNSVSPLSTICMLLNFPLFWCYHLASLHKIIKNDRTIWLSSHLKAKKTIVFSIYKCPTVGSPSPEVLLIIIL